jgi:hypothetical protein
MKELVMWVMLGCLLIGLVLFFLGRFIEKGVQLKGIFAGEERESKLGDRLIWLGIVLFGLGLVLMVWVFPNL